MGQGLISATEYERTGGRKAELLSAARQTQAQAGGLAQERIGINWRFTLRLTIDSWHGVDSMYLHFNTDYDQHMLIGSRSQASRTAFEATEIMSFSFLAEAGTADRLAGRWLNGPNSRFTSQHDIFCGTLMEVKQINERIRVCCRQLRRWQ